MPQFLKCFGRCQRDCSGLYPWSDDSVGGNGAVYWDGESTGVGEKAVVSCRNDRRAESPDAVLRRMGMVMRVE